jgi:hypothetical protein
MPTEADTCRTLITPKLQAAGWCISSLSASIGERAGVRCRKCYFDGGQLEIAAEPLHELDADGKKLRVAVLTGRPICRPALQIWKN